MSDTFDENEAIGIPHDMRVKRKYTMSDAALDQRRQAAMAPKPGMAGVRNNFKTGQYAKSFLGRIRPCKRTCAHYPCELVEDGATTPGKDCLDKAELLSVVRAVHSALTDPENGAGDFKDIAALSIANNITILEMLQEDIMRDGTVLKSTKDTKHGQQVEYKMHPSLLALPKMIAELGMTPEQFMITPKAQAKQKTEEEGVKSIAEMLGMVGKKLSSARKDKNDGTGPVG